MCRKTDITATGAIAGSDRLRQGYGESAEASAKAEDPASTIGLR